MKIILSTVFRKRYKTKQDVNNASLFDRYEVDDGRDDMILLTNTGEGYEHAGDKIIGMVNLCADAKTEDFKACFKKILAILRERIQFEDTILEKRIAPRIRCVVRVRLTVPGKQSVLGNTIDVSETGCLVMSDETIKDFVVGDRAMLHYPEDDTLDASPCVIVRLTGDRVAVQFMVFCPDSLLEKTKSLFSAKTPA